MALNLEQYAKTQWAAEMPITAERMDNLEEGVRINREALRSVNDLPEQLQARPTTTEVQSLVDQSAAQGAWARTEIVNTFDGDTYTSLRNRFIKDEEKIAEIKDMFGTKTNEHDEVVPAYDYANSVYANIKRIDESFYLLALEVRNARTNAYTNYTHGSLYEHMAEVDNGISDLRASIAAIEDSAGDGYTLVSRIHQLEQLQAEIDAARRAVGEGEEPDTLQKRFISIDGQINNLLSSVGSLNDNKVNKSDIINDLIHTDADKVLSAGMGKNLRDMIGGDYDSINTVANAISTASTTVENNAKAYTDSKDREYNVAEINAAHRDLGLDPNTEEVIVDSLNKRFTDAETDISALQAELTAAHSSTAADATYNNLDARLEAIESAANSSRADIDTIAGELSMTNIAGQIVDTTSRIDQLEENVVAMANEIGMLQNGAAVEDMQSAILGDSTRIDTLETEIGNAHRTGSDTLDTRFDEIEAAISHVADPEDSTDLGGLTERMTAVESLASSAKTTADAAATQASLNTLAGRVQTLEQQPKSATVVIGSDRITYDETTGVPTIYTDDNKTTTITPSVDSDYLLQNGDKYYYWKYIKTGSYPDTFEWALISGGGSGSGNTSGYDLTAQEYEALESYSENTDYYVTRDDGIHHYRYVGDTEYEIGSVIASSNIKTYNIARVDTTRVNSETNAEEPVTYLNLYEFDYGADNTGIDDQSSAMHLRGQVELPRGGGGGSTTTSVNRLIRIGDQTIQKIVGSTVMLQVFYSSHDSTGTESNSGAYTLRTGSTIIEQGTLNSGAFGEDIEGYKENTVGYYQFDVSNYCRTGSTNFTLNVEVNGATIGKNWTVTIVDLRIETTAPETALINSTEPYNFPYTPYGALAKTLYVKIDNGTAQTVSLPSTTSGRATTYQIPAQSHGSHKIEMYLKATVGGIEQTTSSIIRQYIWYDAENTDAPVILASSLSGQTVTAQQYSTTDIQYQVYKQGVSSIAVDYYLDDATDPYDHVVLEDTNVGTLSYLATTSGEHTITIKVEDQSIVVNFNITPLDINVSPVSGAIIDFDPTSLTNSSSNRLPSWTVGSKTYALTASENFNWSDDASGGGYKNEEDGKAFVIKAGSYVDLNYPFFGLDSQNKSVLDNGAEMKIIFKTSAVRDIEAVWFNNTGTVTNKTVGLQLGTHYGWLKTDKAANTNQQTAGTEYPAWVSGNTYNLDSIVIYKDTVYKCIKVCVDNIGVVPGSTDGAKFWTLLTGDDIPQDTTGIAAWSASSAYDKGTIVSYNSGYYSCKKAVTNEITTNPKDASDNWLSMGKIDTEVLATNSYLYFPYSENDKIELDININKYEASKDNNFIMSYEDGVPSKAYSYNYGAGGDVVSHDGTIRIGSPDCDVYIYHLRIYNKSLETSDILQNFIADGRDIDEKVTRYNRNCIYWDPTQNDGHGKYFTSPSGTAYLDPVKLAEVMPNVKVLMLDTPVFTVGKKNFVKGTTLRCIHAKGGDIYPSRGDADNWFFQNGFHSGQGTTSDNYGQSSRNVDFLFEVDDSHWPAKKKDIEKVHTPSADYVSSVLIGENASRWEAVAPGSEIYHWVPAREPDEDVEVCKDWKGDECKVTLTSTSVPNNYFNLKVNVASSENVNNALFQKRYDDFLTYNSPATAAQRAAHAAGYRNIGVDPTKVKVKNSMEFVPAVLFVRENDPDTSKHTEFKDTNWHFYALGNIGDSKKTDYTRAYAPDDMNEFTCENSDNNTNNGQFQSGVFTYQGHEGAIETRYEAYDSEATYEEGAITVNNGTIQVYDGTNWTPATLVGWTDQEAPYFAPYTAPNPMEYTYPITSSQWNVKIGNEYVNYKHYTLETEEFDGDHSFEFRYACRGDYRDGSLINESDGQDDDTQFELNHNVMLAFYEWLITANETQFAAEAEQWFVKSAMEFFYAYTHYYTMMDNRAKNTFWHFAKTGRYVEASRPIKELLHVYEESSDNGQTWARATGTEIDPNKKYRTQYAFDLWAYDMDTAAGIDNNGALVFPYGKEDTDYRTEGDAASGYAFNGAGSIFWRRLRTTFESEIRDIMNNADANCFNSEDLIEEFDEFQNCFPEEIWRLDIERKYIRTFTGESIDNSVTTGKQNPRFLTSMMQGRKKYQRRQWIRDQGVYFNSKYRLTDIISNANTIEFNCTTPANTSDLAVAPSYYLKLIPYQDMYLNVQIGNGNYQPQTRAKAGVEYTYNLSGNYQETRIYINGANHLSGIGNLAPMYPYAFDLRALAHIKTLDIGTDATGYVNTKFTELVLPNYAPLLERLNIKNCHSVAGTINLKNANNIREVDAEGTVITGISLPDYTNIEKLHLPSSVTALNLYGARFLDDFAIINSLGNTDYSNLFKLHVYDSDYSENVDWMSIAVAMLEKRSLETELSLLRLNVATIGDIQTLDPMNEFKTTLEAARGTLELGGTIHVTGSWSEVEKDTYEETWPALTLDVSEGTLQPKYKVVYKYDDYYDSDNNLVRGQEIKTLYIRRGEPVIDIWEYFDDETQEKVHMLDEMPSRASTVQNNYQFGLRSYDRYVELSGWKENGATEPISAGSPVLVNSNMIIETYFKVSTRTYPIKWYLQKNANGTPRESTLVKTSANPVKYGDGYDEEAPTIADIHNLNLETATATVTGGQVTYSIFTGWEKLPTNINPTVDDTSYNIFGTWDTQTIPLIDLFEDVSTLTPAQLLALSVMDNNAKNTYIADKIAVGKQFTYTMGHDSIVSGVELIPNIMRLDLGNPSRYVTAVAPFAEGNDAFTIAVDYCFNPNGTYNSQYSAAALMSCYGIDSSANTVTGFALYDNLNENFGALGPRVGFGDMFNNSTQSVPVGNTITKGYRNMVVLRHPAGSSMLEVYSGLDNNMSLYNEIKVQQLSWNSSSTSAVINFGQLTNNTSTDYAAIKAIVTGAKGTVYWAKYWNEDLGVGECKRLAAWPHEDITYAFTAIQNTVTSGSRAAETAPTPSISLTAVSVPSHGKVAQQITATQVGDRASWSTSVARTICNNRVFFGLPTELQAILCKPMILAKDLVISRDAGTNMNITALAGTGTQTRDYVYLPSALNLGDPSVTSAYNGEESTFASYITPYQWLSDTTSVVIYNYSPTSSGSWVTSADSTRAYYLNIRFANKPLTWSTTAPLRIFRISSSVTLPSSSTIYTEINKIGGGIKEGDIYINQNGEAYMYINNADITDRGLQNVPNDGIFSTETGGWIASSDYWTRSMGYSAQKNNFVYVDTSSALVLGDTKGASANGLSLNYSLQI